VVESGRVLVVDDEPIVREVLARYLSREGFDVEVAQDGRAALEALDRAKPDLILLDLMLPQVDGLEVFRRLRPHDRPAVIMLTARGDLLHFMASSPDVVFTRVHLLEELWDFAYDGDPSTVTVHIRRLREKIEQDPSNPRRLVTVWGVGYRFQP
jgi:DNA-binding response OmpR family regulator